MKAADRTSKILSQKPLEKTLANVKNVKNENIKLPLRDAENYLGYEYSASDINTLNEDTLNQIHIHQIRRVNQVNKCKPTLNQKISKINTNQQSLEPKLSYLDVS